MQCESLKRFVHFWKKMKYGELKQRKTMQRLHLGKGNERPQYGEVLLAQLRRLWALRCVSTIRGFSMLLVSLSAWPKSGTVVPHCDFQKVSLRIGLYKGSFLYVHPRNACRRAPPRNRRNTMQACAQLNLYYYLQIGRALKPQAVSLKNGSF